MKKPDLDAIENLLATEAADPFAIIEHVPALLTMARRTEEAHVGGIVDRCDRDAALDACAARIAELLDSAEQAERERDEVASKTSDGYRDAHAAYQRWAAKLAPDAIGDEQKRAAIDARIADCHVLGLTRTEAIAELAKLQGSRDSVAAERDDARAALVRLLWRSIADDAACSCATGDACPECQAMQALGLGRWTGASDATREIRALPERTPARPPLDPVHRGALIGLLERAAQQLEDADRPHKVDAARAQIAALQAVLGEEASR